jgi:RNA polymerase sigma-70 factor (ECF subfamily)
MRVGRVSLRAPAGPSSPEAERSPREGPALDRPPHEADLAAHQSEPTGDRTGGRSPARTSPGLVEHETGDALDRALDLALDRARRGDEGGFAQLWRALHPPLLRYLTVRGDEAPEDIAAETWLQVVRDLRGFRGGYPEFRAWLFTIARHRAVDQGRARAARPVVPVAEPHDVQAHDARADAVPSAEQHAAERESTAAALRLVATLPRDQAELVMLRVVAGLDVATVAEIVGKKPGAVRVAVHRALKSLARTTNGPTNGPTNGREVV